MDWRNLFNHAVRLGFNAYEARDAIKRSEDMASSARELAERLPATSNTPQTVNAPEGSNLAPVEPFSEPVLSTEQPGAPRPQQIQQTSRGKECRPCTSDHFATCAGVLEEALRFARADGLENDEVVERVALCAEQMNAWERWDAAPQSFEDLAEEDKAFLRQWLPKGRSFRHRLNTIQSMEDLERVAGEAHRLHLNARKELRGRHSEAGTVSKSALAPEALITLEEAKAEAAQIAAEEVEKAWESSEHSNPPFISPLSFTRRVLGPEASERLRRREVTQTIRSDREVAGFSIGDIMEVTLDGEDIGDARLVSISQVRLSDLDQDDAIRGGFTSVEELRAALRRAGFRFLPLEQYVENKVQFVWMGG